MWYAWKNAEQSNRLLRAMTQSWHTHTHTHTHMVVRFCFNVVVVGLLLRLCVCFSCRIPSDSRFYFYFVFFSFWASVPCQSACRFWVPLCAFTPRFSRQFDWASGAVFRDTSDVIISYFLICFFWNVGLVCCDVTVFVELGTQPGVTPKHGNSSLLFPCLLAFFLARKFFNYQSLQAWRSCAMTGVRSSTFRQR